jgi:hypothetical protein
MVELLDSRVTIDTGLSLGTRLLLCDEAAEF